MLQNSHMQFREISPDVHVATQPPKPSRWFGLPFAAAAMLPLLGATGMIPFQNEAGEPASRLFLAVFALPFLAIGWGMLLWRVHVVVDLAAGTVTRRSGVGPLAATHSRRLAQQRAVVHEKRIIRGNRSSRTVWPVLLESGSSSGFDLFFCRDRQRARQTAEAVAKLLELAVVDRTDGTERRREADELDLSLRDRRARREEPLELAPPPTDLRSDLRVDGDAIVVEIPPFGFTPFHLLAMVLATGPLAMVTVFVSLPDDTPEPVFLIAAFAIGALPTFALEFAIVWHALRRHTVRASAQELRITEFGLRRRTISLPAESVEELAVAEPRGNALASFLGGGPAITACSDEQLVTFGHSLPHREAQHLADVLRGAVSAPATRER